MFVYRVTNVITGKQYVGICTCKVRRRWRRHVNVAQSGRHGSPALHAAIRKYGEEAFQVETLYEGVSWREIQAVERGLIAAYGTMAPNGYNLTCGGEGVLGLRITEAQRLAMSQRAKGRKRSPESLAKLSRSLKGRTISPETREIQRRQAIARMANPEARKAISLANKGRKHSQETVEKVRAASLGRKHSAATRAKMSAWQIGKIVSPETGKRISRAKRTWRVIRILDNNAAIKAQEAAIWRHSASVQMSLRF